jgi:NAD(P)-dependent dehydrogenase (short-subunit alcohol dehydrogenase family)
MTKIPVALVTGASRGLGRGIAQGCAQAGCSVAIHYVRNKAAAQETVSLCRAASIHPEQQFIPIQGDMAIAREGRGILEQTLSVLGHLDVLVNTAGIAPRARADITETAEASYDEVMAVNLKGPYFLSQLAARYWLAHPGQSRIESGYKLVFITSISANTASVNRGEYCMAKAGLSMAAQLWATRLASHGAQVFEIRPGLMETDMTAAVREKYDKLLADGLVPQMRWGKPEDTGAAVEAIVRGYFPFSTGAVIPVDGGFHLQRL